MKKKYLVTTALPYANGEIHLGHVMEGILADIWVRFQKSIGNECYFFCADDTHGTPVMLAAKNKGISPEQMIEEVRENHVRDLTGFLINYDHYYTTNSKENKQLCEEIYLNLKKNNYIKEDSVEQFFCEHDQMFLPDRFIKGICPKCKSENQYGDSCEVCGSTYNSSDIIQPKCSLCNHDPVKKNSKHLFVKLSSLEEYLKNWIKNAKLQESAKNKLKEWFEAGLTDWDISRDGPYFGFEIPGEQNKYFYVWLDAPIGYMATSLNYFHSRKLNIFDQFWKDGNTEIVHFIGKDILYFHALFWPAILHGSGFKPPTEIHVHGFVTVQGEKMSKSRGTFINAEKYLKNLDSEHLRFYLASKIGSGLEDIDFSFSDFTAKVNSDLVGNLVNIISRIGTTILDKLDRNLGKVSQENQIVLNELLSYQNEIRQNYDSKSYSKVLRIITSLSDKINKIVNDFAPWNFIKSDVEGTRNFVTFIFNATKILYIYIYPVVPKISESFFGLLENKIDPTFENLEQNIESQRIKPYKNLTTRVNEDGLKNMMEKETNNTKVVTTPEPTIENYIEIDDLVKVDLRAGKILAASEVEGAEKLLQLKVDLGELGIKNVFAGIKSTYKPEELVDRIVVVVANLKPRKMKFGISEAMILASGEKENLTLYVPHKNAKPGDRLK